MKPSRKFLLSLFVLAGLSFALAGCETDGYVGVSNDLYYGPGRDPWFRDDPWMDDHGWYGRPGGSVNVGIYLHPPRQRW
jgi:hypothetical protein